MGTQERNAHEQPFPRGSSTGKGDGAGGSLSHIFITGYSEANNGHFEPPVGGL